MRKRRRPNTKDVNKVLRVIEKLEKECRQTKVGKMIDEAEKRGITRQRVMKIIDYLEKSKDIEVVDE